MLFRRTTPAVRCPVSHRLGALGRFSSGVSRHSAFPLLRFSGPVSRFPAFPLSRFSALPPFRFSLPLCRFALPVLIAWLGLGAALGDDRVVVRAKADPEYVAAKFGRQPPKDETYLVAQGRYFDGSIVDRTMRRTSFLEVMKSLSGGLAKQHFFPTKDLEKADLLILVHWGMTSVADSSYRLLAQNALRADDPDRIRRDQLQAMAAGDAMHDLAADANASYLANYNWVADDRARVNDNLFQEIDQMAQSVSMASNARLLGFAEELVKDNQSVFGTSRGEMVRSMLSDPRYFVILMAYDYQALRAGRRRLLWSARLSMQVAGMGFRQGIGHMATVGSTCFGLPSDGLQVRRPVRGEANVEVGPVRVIGMPAE